MKNPSKYAAKLTGTGVLALLLASSAFADSGPQKETEKHEGRHRAEGQASQQHERGDRGQTQRAPQPPQAAPQQPSNSGRGETAQGRESQRNDNRDAYRGQPRNEPRNSDRSADRNNDHRYDNNNRNNSNNNYRNDHRYDNRPSDAHRYDNNRNDNRGRSTFRYETSYREGGRNTFAGTIRSFSRERDGFRVYLNGGPFSYWIPSSRLNGHQLRVGLSLRLGGLFNGGYVSVDALGWPGDPFYTDPYYAGGYYDDSYYGSSVIVGSGYANNVVRGEVADVDFRNGTVIVRDDSLRRTITVDMRTLDRSSRLDLDDVRIGDRVTLSGSWVRGDFFNADRLDSVSAY